MKKAFWMPMVLAAGTLLVTSAAMAAPPPSGAQRTVPIKVTERSPGGSQEIYFDCIVFNIGDVKGAMYAIGSQMTWNYAKLGLDKGRFQGVGDGLMLYGKFPETKTSGEAPSTPKIEGIFDDGYTLIAEPLPGSCAP
jgi:hypothetical protein